MEIILYITGGIALLALAWLFISIAMTVKSAQGILVDVRSDLGTVVATVNDLKTEILPILGNVNGITANIGSIASGLQTQMISVHETIDDTLDVVRGTLDDIERLKDQVVATVEGPVTLVRSTADGAVGAVFKGVGMLKKLLGAKKSSSTGAVANKWSRNQDSTTTPASHYEASTSTNSDHLPEDAPAPHRAYSDLTNSDGKSK